MAAPASSPSSASNSQVSAADSSLAKVEPPPDESKEIMGSEEQTKEPMKDPIDILEGDEYIEKLQRYEADYKQYLMSKYFTDKTIFGGNIFDVKMNIDGHTTTAARYKSPQCFQNLSSLAIMLSLPLSIRLPPYQSYLDPVSFDDQNNDKGSNPSAEIQPAAIQMGSP